MNTPELTQLEQRCNPSRRYLAWLTLRWLFWRISRRGYQAGKRLMDMVIASASLVLFSPLIVLIALAIKLQDGGPVLFWQTRIGRWGKPFRFPKFRSMVVNAETLLAELQQNNQHGTSSHTFKIKNDPRISPVGRLLRKTSLDELPQLWCVLKGDMALVGPRPALPQEVARYTPHDRQRLEVTPGLTCTWQVSGRAELAFPQQLQLDLSYIQQQSLKQDLLLLLKTIPAVVSGRGAY